MEFAFLIILILIFATLVYISVHLVAITDYAEMIHELIQDFCKCPEIADSLLSEIKAEPGPISRLYPASSCEVIIRDKATNHILARRHIEDPETISAMDDPLKIVDFGPSDEQSI